LDVNQFDLREAARAVVIARDTFPLIEPRGLGVYQQPYVANHHSFDEETGLLQIATAIEFLLTAAVTDVTSYGAKSMAERWGRENGMAPYVSNGAMIVAAVYLDMITDAELDGTVHLG
jgi:hypothetical protein